MKTVEATLCKQSVLKKKTLEELCKPAQRFKLFFFFLNFTLMIPDDLVCTPCVS